MKNKTNWFVATMLAIAIGGLVVGCNNSGGGGPATRPRDPKEVSASNLRQIAVVMMMYAEEHKGQWPRTAADVKTMELADETLTSPLSGKPYVYTGRPGSRSETDPSIMAYDPGTPAGGHVLTAGGRVRWLDGAALQSAITKGRVE